MIDRRPALIARCTDTADVVAAVKFAREQGLGVAIRGGGHNAAGLAVADGALVVDLGDMNAVEVDPSRRTATAGGGTTWGGFDAATHPYGLATTGGAISMTGVAGLTLGGGLGWLMRSYGLACDNLIGAEVVTADGGVVNVGEDQNSDLLWGLRGGGGNFGIVTNFAFALQPLGPTVLAGMVAWPMDQAPEVLRFLREFIAVAPDEVGVMANLRLAPPLPIVPEHLWGKPIVALIATYAGPVDEGRDALAPIQRLRTPAFDAVMPKPYVTHQKMFDAAYPHGRHYYWKAHKLGPLTDEIIDAVVDHAARITSPLSAALRSGPSDQGMWKVEPSGRRVAPPILTTSACTPVPSSATPTTKPSSLGSGKSGGSPPSSATCRASTLG